MGEKTDFETVAVPKDILVERVIEGAKEYGEYMGDPTYHPGPRGPGVDVEWSYSSIDSWDVDIVDEENFVLVGIAEGTYSEKVRRERRNPPGKAHPAEYKNHTADVGVEITVDAENPPDGIWSYTIEARCL